MSSAEILSLISTISYVLAAAFCLLAVMFWFLFKIPATIGDLSGRTAKKTIEKIRANNERVGGIGYQPSITNARRGKLTDTIRSQERQLSVPQKSPARAQQPKQPRGSRMPETGVLETYKPERFDMQQTELLDGSQGINIPTDENATVALFDEPAGPAKRAGGKKLTMINEVIMIHTDEVIPT